MLPIIETLKREVFSFWNVYFYKGKRFAISLHTNDNIALRIVLCFSITNCLADYSFPDLKEVKNSPRSGMEKKLNSLEKKMNSLLGY